MRFRGGRRPPTSLRFRSQKPDNSLFINNITFFNLSKNPVNLSIFIEFFGNSDLRVERGRRAGFHPGQCGRNGRPGSACGSPTGRKRSYDSPTEPDRPFHFLSSSRQFDAPFPARDYRLLRGMPDDGKCGELRVPRGARRYSLVTCTSDRAVHHHGERVGFPLRAKPDR